MGFWAGRLRRLRERIAARQVLRLRGRFRGRRGLVAFLAVMGPGLIAGIAGNDAGGITTYSVMGATTGLTLLWIFPITIAILAIVQEMAARLGVVTGQGLSDLIRDRFGVRPTAFAMVVLLVANLANTVAEFSGAAAALELFGISRYLVVPIVAVAIWALVIKASYRTVERVFLCVIVVFLAYIVSAVLADPDWGKVGRALVTPSLDLQPATILLMVAVVGHDHHPVHAVLPDQRGGREGHRRGRARRWSRRTRSVARSGPTSSRSSSSSPPPARSGSPAGPSRRRRTRPRRSSRSPAGWPRRSSRSGCSGRASWRRRSCRCRRRS